MIKGKSSISGDIPIATLTDILRVAHVNFLNCQLGEIRMNSITRTANLGILKGHMKIKIGQKKNTFPQK